ncbi:lysylphosphatidylglycerol synthase transmembrane domain-containing protein [Weissella tructae]|uniref:Phosphatidylglycerol lysyltransferase n=2 Tax=Weissella TaxID=46255 RepID=A0A075TY69_9LACO|nr:MULTISPECIES: lysylphosphatidylglycerol synthase transmembrane domain-containing protein [Weissella]AIG65160.1 hypothetical protein WS08_0221 [Weissella tructae]AIM62473.1 hypothetical protein WS74_0221 [Weissella ceti]AIM63810.1 hypothetical protein WS105_0220 [Weissella ceti]ELA07857.1 integral membrane protein [Weissella ceti NC36]QVV91545.1 YbhN family protein [Weissella tructae]
MSRRNLIIFITMLLFGCLIFAWSFRDVSLQQFMMDMQSANLWWLAVAVLCMAMYLLLEAAVVKLFIDETHQKLSWRDAIRVPLVEQLGNGITPFASGGQPMQLVALMQAGVEAGKAGSILTMKFIIYQGMIVVNFILALIVGYQYIHDKLQEWSTIVWLGFGMHVIVVMTLLALMFLPRITNSLVNITFRIIGRFSAKKAAEWRPAVDEQIEGFHQESLVMKANMRYVIGAAVITFVQLMFYYMIPYFILLSLGAKNVDVVLILALHILIVMVISLFPIPGGSGGAEVGFAVLFQQFLPTHAKLMLAMLLWRLITYYLGMVAGVIAFGIPTTKQKMRQTN